MNLKTPLRIAIGLAALVAGVLAYAQSATGDGEIRKIDAEQKKLTLKHGEIKALDMPPMTMVYRVKDPALLSSLAVGDHVSFSVEKLDGAYTITRIEKK